MTKCQHNVDVHIYDQQSDLSISKLQVEKLVKECLKFEGVECDEVSIQFVDTDIIKDLHLRYFDDGTTTDCISFPIDQEETAEYRVLGEVFVCPKTGIDYTSANRSDPYREISLYIIHGLLHLMGYDDIGDEEPEMREAEQRHMDHLQSKSLLLKEPTCTS